MATLCFGSVVEWSKALVLGTSHFDDVGSNPTAASCLIIRHLSFEPGCMSPWRYLVFGVYMAYNPCCIQFMFIFQISLISFHLQRLSRFKSTSNLKISSKNNNQYIIRESHWYLHSCT